MATRSGLTKDVIKATENQQINGVKKSFLGSKSNDDQLSAFHMTAQIMKYEDFIRDAEKQL